MTKIIVDPDELRNEANVFLSARVDLEQIILGLRRSVDTLRGLYDGQLHSRLDGLTAQVQGKATEFQSRFNELSEYLNKKGVAFEAADSTNESGTLLLLSGLGGLNSSSSVWWPDSTFMRGHLHESLNSLWLLGGFGFGALSNWVSTFPPFSRVIIEPENKLAIESHPTPLPTTETTIKLSFLSQNNPTGNEMILNTQIPTYGITVRDDITHEGCQMISYNMLLIDLGFKASITDLYKANWEIVNTNKTWDVNTLTKTGINDKYTSVEGGLIGRVTNDQYSQEAIVIVGKDDASRQASLSTYIKERPVILWVKTDIIPQHHIIIDAAQPEKGPGYFIVRDPLATESGTIKIGSDGKYDFALNKEGIGSARIIVKKSIR